MDITEPMLCLQSILAGSTQLPKLHSKDAKTEWWKVKKGIEGREVVREGGEERQGEQPQTVI